MAYESYLKSSGEREREIQDARSKLDEAITPFNIPTPRPFPDEDRDSYRKRTLPLVQRNAPNYQNVKVAEAYGSVFDLLEKQIYDDARREAQHPTNIPDGELRQVVTHDQSGRPIYSYYGKAGTWLSQFATDKRRLMGIRTETQRGYDPRMSLELRDLNIRSAPVFSLPKADLQHLGPSCASQVIDIVGSSGQLRENVVPRRR